MLYTSQKQVRAAFWEQWEGPRRAGGQNEQTTDCRVAWCDFVESLHRNGDISDKLAERVTL